MKLFNKNIDRREFNKLLIKSALTSFSLTMLNKDILLASDPPGGGEENSISHGTWTDGWLEYGFYLPPIGQGYMGYGADNKRWGNNIFVNEIKSIAASWDSLGGTIGIGNISLQNGGYMAPSSSHQNGNDGDFFYVGNDFNWVNVNGITAIALVHEFDFSSIIPTQSNDLTIAMFESANKPFLTISYSNP